MFDKSSKRISRLPVDRNVKVSGERDFLPAEITDQMALTDMGDGSHMS